MKLRNSTSFFAAVVALTLPLGADDETAEVKPTGKAPSEAIRGYWVPDKDAFLEAILKQAGGDGEVGETERASITKIIEDMASKVAFHFADGESQMITPGGLEKATWKVVSEDAKTGEMKVTVTKANGKTEDSEVVVVGDTMLVINREQDVRVLCRRVSEEEFKKRVKMAEAAAKTDGAAPE